VRSPAYAKTSKGCGSVSIITTSNTRHHLNSSASSPIWVSTFKANSHPPPKPADLYSDHPLRSLPMRHSSLVFLPLALVFPPLITSGCGSSDPIVSSSSHWLTCRDFSDCAVTEEAVACEQGYCVDAEDKRIEIPETSVGGSSSGGRDGQDPGTGGTA